MHGTGTRVSTGAEEGEGGALLLEGGPVSSLSGDRSRRKGEEEGEGGGDGGKAAPQGLTLEQWSAQGIEGKTGAPESDTLEGNKAGNRGAAGRKVQF